MVLFVLSGNGQVGWMSGRVGVQKAYNVLLLHVLFPNFQIVVTWMIDSLNTAHSFVGFEGVVGIYVCCGRLYAVVGLLCSCAQNNNRRLVLIPIDD